MKEKTAVNKKKKVKRKIVCMMLVAVILVCCFSALSGCQSNEEEDSIKNDKESYGGPYLAYKGQYTTYPIDDVTLTFYYGSDSAGENKIAGSLPYDEYPVVTYIYFRTAEAYSSTGLTKADLLDVIEENDNFYICKKMLSTDADSFYKCNGVTRLYTKLSCYDAYTAWGENSPLYYSKYYSSKGIVIPDVSNTFTIPSKFFNKEKGYVYFGMASYLMDDYAGYACGHMLESSGLVIYYTNYGDYVTLSSHK